MCVTRPNFQEAILFLLLRTLLPVPMYLDSSSRYSAVARQVVIILGGLTVARVVQGPGRR